MILYRFFNNNLSILKHDFIRTLSSTDILYLVTSRRNRFINNDDIVSMIHASSSHQSLRRTDVPPEGAYAPWNS